ncbi:MAG: T9SS type A sorting domain-containing protein, partial [Bacteroidota bacterium]|nr:T9SS type A sorting domain-containing protein [Bacteroidota bacterium]
MKKLISFFTLSLCFLFIAMSSNAQVTVSGAVVGNGGYPTLKDAFDAINGGAQTGAAILIDISASTVEPVTARLNENDWTSLTITPSAVVTVTGSDTVTIKLAGADRVTIDGRIAGAGRNLSVLNTSTISTSTAIWLAHGGFATTDSLGAKNNIIRNLEIACGVTQNTITTTTTGILASGTTRGVSGRHNDSNQYLENRIIRCRLGISLSGGVATSRSVDNLIAGNIVGPTSFGPDQIGITGILVTFQTRCIITKNQVQFVGGTFATTTGGADRIGIGLGINSWSSTTTSTTTGSDNIVSQNIVHDIIEERTFSSLGILIGQTLSGPKTNNLIVNNVVYNVRANSTPGDQCVGIGHSGGPGDRIVFNSISISGDLDPAGTVSASTNPVCAGISKHVAAAADTAVLIKDNAILVDATTNTTTLLKAAIIGPAVGYAFGSGGLDYNDYWIPTPGVNGQVTGITGTGTVSFTTLAAWQAAYTPPQDAASIQCDPLFVVNLQPAVGSCLVLAGTPIAGIVDDIVKVARDPTNPTIGAWETALVPPIDVGVVSAIIGTSPNQIISVGKGYNIVATVRNFGPTVLVDSVFYTVNAGSPVGPVSAGVITGGGSAPAFFTGGNAFTPTIPGINTIRIYTSLTADANHSNDTLTLLVNVQQKIAAYPYIQTFTNPVNWTVVVENAVGTTALWGLGICTNPDGKVPDTAATSNCFNGSTGRREILRSPEMDLTGLATPILNFYSAYRTFQTEDDSLEVVVSTDGGVTFFSATTVYNKGFTSVPSLATRPPSITAFFPDSAKQWRHETIDLANVAGNGNVVLGFRSKSQFGNRQWVDNVIVSNATGLCTDAVIAPGSYSCNSLLTIDFNTVGLQPMKTSNQSDNLSGIMKTNSDRNIVGSFASQTGNVNVISNNQTDNPTGGTLAVAEYDNDATVQGNGVQNTTGATAPDATVFTPDVVYQDFWFNVTYTGNDYLGYATYDINIDISSIVFNNPGKVYIVKRTDRTGLWNTLNTTLSGGMLSADYAFNTDPLSTFSDFALAGDSISNPLPVELSSFISVINRRDVTLNWATASELNNAGFDVERSVLNGSWSKVGSVTGNGTSTTPNNYSYTDRNLASGKYNYRLKQIDLNGNFTYYELTNEVNVGVPTKFDLSQNYPNPFNPSTKINYDLPFDGKVSVKIFDMAGKEVSTLVNEVKTAGYYTINFNASNLSSGVYFYRISAEANGQNFVSTKKMML